MANDKIYQKVTEYLKQEIASGKMKLGDAIYSENQLCEMLNVSRTSVRRAIREMVELNILESRQGAGTFVKGLNPSKTICFVNHYTRTLRYSPVDTYYANLIFSVEHSAEKENHRFQIFSGMIKTADDIGSKMSHLNADGIILDGQFQDFFSKINVFQKYYKNLVILDGDPSQAKLPAVVSDLISGYIELLSLIPESGTGKILFLHNNAIVRNRWALDCFKAALRESSRSQVVEYCDYTANIPSDICNCVTHDHLVANVLDELMAKHHYKAIICDSDRVAMYAIKYLKDRNYSIPDDIAVSGVGNTVYSGMTAPVITTLQISPSLLASVAIEVVGKQIRGEKIQQLNLVPVQLLRRESM